MVLYDFTIFHKLQNQKALLHTLRFTQHAITVSSWSVASGMWGEHGVLPPLIRDVTPNNFENNGIIHNNDLSNIVISDTNPH